MKKLLTLAFYALPLAVTPAVFAQTGAATAPQTQSSPTAPPTPGPAAPATGGMTPAPASPGMGAAPSAPPSKPAQMISGLSVKDRLMGKNVYNEKDEKIGAIEDVVLTPEGKASNLVIGAGGFLGMGEHNVAIPFDKVSKTGDKLMLTGYTKDQLKELPEVKVTK